MSTATPGRDAPTRQLTLFDSTSIIVGIIIGAGLYETTPLIAQNVPSAAWLVGIWILGGCFSLVGALCYAELATAYPEEGGDYVYLSQAFDRPIPFLFAWAQLWVVRPGSIGAMAYVFARYANQLVPLKNTDYPLVIYASVSIGVLTVINVLGVKQGKWTQNLLTTAKVLGLLAVFAVGFLFPAESGPPQAVKAAAGTVDYKLAMIFVLFAYGGWNEMAYVGAEVRDPRKNILRALVLGTCAVTVIYVLANLAFLYSLGFEGTRQSQAVAVDVVKPWLTEWGGRAIAALIAISALGAINGQIFTGSRIYYAMGTEHRLYAVLGRWSRYFGTPVWSLVIQAVVTLALVVGFGLTQQGDKGGFEPLVKFTTPAFWFFLLLVGLSLFILRRWAPDRPNTYRVFGYPFLPILFCLSSLFMLYAGMDYAIRNQSYEGIWSVVVLVVGLVFSAFDPKPEKK
ncbi:MAG: APC family permease [Pirellulales bacterium]